MSKIKESLLLNIVFPLADLVMGTRAMHWYRQIDKMNTWSKKEIDTWQLDQLKALIQQAYHHTVYYREVFDKLGLTPDDINSIADIKKLPVLTKDIIKSRFDDFVPDNIQLFKHRFSSTGGSTGTPFKFIVDENTWGFITAMKIHSWKKTGYHYGDLYLSLGSSSLFPVNKKSIIHEFYYRLRNTIPLNGMNMDDAVCEKYVDIIRKNKVRYIYGYTSAIYLLALYTKKMHIDLKMEGVFATSEKLTNEYRQLIESTWNTRVTDCYGSRDGGVTAYEINRGTLNVGYNTICQTNSKTESTMYCTNTLNLAFPMIRYELGDEVEFGDVNNLYNGQTISQLIGRTSDIISLDNGHKLTPTGFSIMIRNFNVEAFRMTKVDGNTLKLEIQKRANFTKEEEALIYQTMKKHAGEDSNIHIDYVDQFETLKNGKRNFFVNS